MKKILINFVVLFLIISLKTELKSKGIQISNPIITDYYGCVHKGDLIIAYGNYGVINVSQDDGKTWKTQKIFDKGKIINVLFVDNVIIAFNENGEISESSNNARYFLPVSKLELENGKVLLQCIKFNDDYIVRSHDFFLALNNKFEFKKRIDLPKLDFFNYSTKKTNTISVLDNQLLVSIDSGKIYKYDKILNLIEVIDLSKEGFISSWYDLNFLSEKLIIRNNKKAILFNLSNKKKDTLIDFFDKTKSFNPFLGQVVNNQYLFIQNQDELDYKLYFVNENKNLDSTIIIENQSYANFEYNQSKEKITFVSIKDNKFILVGEKNTIIISETSKDNDDNLITKTNEVSKGYGFHTFNLDEPYRLDSTVIFNFKNGYDKSHFLFEIADNNNLIKSKIPIYHLENGILNSRYFDTKKVVRIKNYDFEKKQYTNVAVYGGGFSTGCRLFKTNDFFASKFEYDDFTDGLIDYTSTDFILDNFRFIDSTCIFTTYSSYNNRHFSQINIYTNNFDSISNFNFYNKEIANTKVIYCFAQDINNLFYVNQDLSNYNLNFINSTENFQKFDTLYKFQNVTIEKFKEINHFGRKYFAYLTYNSENYNYTIEMFDVLNFQKYTLFEGSDDELFIENINFDMYQDKIYISFGNKFMKLTGSIENPEWEGYSLPNNGMIDNYMYIQNNFLYCRYEDEKNELNLYRIELVDSLVNSAEVDVNSELNDFEYVYLYEPYPNPTNNEINTEVFWSNSFDIENSDIGVFNINGNKVSSPTNLSLEKLNANKGNIKWNCIGQPKGTYLIKIQHGNNTKTVKVVVD